MSTDPAPKPEPKPADEPETTGWDPLLPGGKPYQPGTDRNFLTARPAHQRYQNRTRGNQ